MSLKTHESKGYGVLMTYDQRSIFLAQREYEYFLQVKDNPNVRFLEFDDGGIAISDIRRYELLRRSASEDRQLVGEDESTLNETDWLERKARLSSKMNM